MTKFTLFNKENGEKIKKKLTPGNIIGTVIALFLIFLIAYFLITQALGGIPQFFGYSIVRIVTPSMESKIPTGSYVLIKHVSPNDIKVDDIITFYTDDPDPVIAGWTITHRVIKITNDEDGNLVFKTKGDNNLAEDAYPARAEKLVGKYIGNVFFLTAIANMLGTKAGLFVALLIPLFLISQIVLQDMTKKTKKEREDYIRQRVQEELETIRKQQGEENAGQIESGDGSSASDRQGSEDNIERKDN